MTTFSGMRSTPFPTLDMRIARARAALGEARLAAARTSSIGAVQRVARAEEHLDALLDFRHAFGHR